MSKITRTAFAAVALLSSLSALAAETAHVTSNPYGIDALWAQGDIVARGTLIILLIMSAATWYVGIVKLLEQRRLLKQGRELLESHGAELQKRASELADEGMFSAVAVAGIEAAAEHKGELAGRVDLNTWVSMAISDAVDSASHHMQNGLSVVATVGSTAPFVGLFGTVWGIYHALTAIGMSGQASIDKVAGPVGEALIMTAIGLGVAVPAVLGYNWLVRRNKLVLDMVRVVAGRLHASLLNAR
ncbi:MULTISPECIES: MotA/TolQ/ExbB proton channel family protein [Chromobacterium]|uniref:MotA/TolQ/ExbB proton channel family protein n=1 Tax=Chromobacterium TaxID=535 RepID=UPI0005BA41F6|nr:MULTISPECIES: MotA/TolQ/ExbB proton channel family protein [Chromobacterium]QOZ83714.1 MotA/TolQ/ExbB proton channel family protein [Chromobacterium sp. Rain0013]QOZ84625.1 MotA/TolQ/ExbB proton channel family protein [Chromobacterium sp. Rain0013]WON83837.1 MotA/TolQ/ExbB proton channel family protein [Chromobacterium haemolyticum]WON84805.1 MotA/TolQ/ExbB proton channel family protein [Chromobacterium haemolyticum]